MWGRVLLAAVCAAGCTFDPTGGSGADLGEPGQPDSAPLATETDAASPDATPDCIDEDGDGFPVAPGGADCGPALDCDDSDPRVYPGQTQFFASARSIGGYDFDCDGAETKINVQQGEQCHLDFFDCRGTGWMVTVPECGTSGIYHECASGFLSCDEAQVTGAIQLCR